MTVADVLDALVKANLASGAAILGVLALRKTARTRFGARLAFGLWLLPVLAGAAVLLPARQVVVVRTAAPMAASVVRIVHGVSAAPASFVAPGPRGLDGPTLLVGLWLAGVAGAALVMAVLQHRFIARARRGGVGPAVVGVIDPRILIPKDFAERFSPQEQALVLAHEEAHLARQDSRLNGLVAALQCLGWFNPLVHLAARLMRVDQELACDESVVRRFPDARRAYAEVLMKAQLAVLPLPLGCYWPSRSQHPLVERVATLKRPRIGRARWRAGAVALGCLWAGAGLAAWASQPAEVRFTASPARDTAIPRSSPTSAFAPSSDGSAMKNGLAPQTANQASAEPKPEIVASGYGPAAPNAAAVAPASDSQAATQPAAPSAVAALGPAPGAISQSDTPKAFDGITAYELQRRMRLLIFEHGVQPTGTLPQFKMEAFSELVDEHLKLREVERVQNRQKQSTPNFNLIPSDREVDDAVGDMAMKNNLTYDQLKAKFATAGVDLNTLRERVRIDISWQRLIGGMGEALPDVPASTSPSPAGG